MKYLILITVSFFFIFSANGNVNRDTTSSIQNRDILVDTVRFVNDTAKLATQPKVSHIVYAEKDSVASILKDFILPIVMLLLGVGIDRFFIWSSNKKRIVKTGKRWIAELRSLLTPIQRQKDAFNSFIKEYCDKEDQYEVSSIALMRSIDGSKFNSLSKEDLYESLENIKGVDCDHEYQKITNIVSTLEFTYSQFIEQWAEFRRRSSNCIEQYNTTVLKYRTLLFDVVAYTDVHKIKKTDLTELIRLFEETISNPPKAFNIFKSKDEFIEPSLAIIRSYKSNPNSVELINTLVGCLDCIEAFKSEKIYIKANFETAMGIYDLVVDTTNQVLETLDSKK